jgi:ribonuclease HI
MLLSPSRLLYTDASIRRGSVGLGVFEDRPGGFRVHARALGASPKDSTGAELLAILLAIRVRQQVYVNDICDLRLFTDSLSSMQLINRSNSDPNYVVRPKYMEILHEIKRTKFSIQKVRAHSGVRGNVAADALAAKGTLLQDSSSSMWLSDGILADIHVTF